MFGFGVLSLNPGLNLRSRAHLCAAFLWGTWASIHSPSFWKENAEKCFWTFLMLFEACLVETSAFLKIGTILEAVCKTENSFAQKSGWFLHRYFHGGLKMFSLALATLQMGKLRRRVGVNEQWRFYASWGSSTLSETFLLNDEFPNAPLLPLLITKIFSPHTALFIHRSQSAFQTWVNMTISIDGETRAQRG